ncbi:MAG: hypothetical protein IT207_04680 [Fimbriimonadaceae bacterium]|nr:hypothetical protein [Fimbriimonadaceae bacterium]
MSARWSRASVRNSSGFDQLPEPGGLSVFGPGLRSLAPRMFSAPWSRKGWSFRIVQTTVTVTPRR